MTHGTEITLHRIHKSFGAVVALDQVDAVFASGTLTALVGKSGSGKSTLLKTINRLVEPDTGAVTIGGKVTVADPVPTLRRRIGYVFQNIGLFPHMNVAQNIAIGLRIAGRGDGTARVAEMLALVDLPLEFADRMPGELSGGQAQRVGIARALAPAPHILLMDEPFGALDPLTRDALGRQVRALHERLGLTTIMVTHDMAEALLLADRILVMEAGTIVADGTPRELLAGKGGAVADSLLAVPRDQARALTGLGA